MPLYREIEERNARVFRKEGKRDRCTVYFPVEKMLRYVDLRRKTPTPPTPCRHAKLVV
jgi:hypothetical protein